MGKWHHHVLLVDRQASNLERRHVLAANGSDNEELLRLRVSTLDVIARQAFDPIAVSEEIVSSLSTC